MSAHIMGARSMSAHVVVRLVSLAAGLRATFRRSAQWCIASGHGSSQYGSRHCY
jgi:hypothetical protein